MMGEKVEVNRGAKDDDVAAFGPIFDGEIEAFPGLANVTGDA